MNSLPCPDDKALCFYHAGCTDGFSAAWAFQTMYRSACSHRTPVVSYIPWTYGRDYEAISSPEKTDRSHYFFLDCAPTLPVYKALVAAGKVVYVIDHHATADRTFHGLSIPGLIDTSRSGAVLTWRFLTDEPVPKLLQYVQDRDLWHHDLEMSKYVNAYINAQRFDFQKWSEMNGQLQTESGFEKIVSLGDALVDYQNKEIDRMISKMHHVVLVTGSERHKIGVVNTSSLVSEVCNEILERDPALAVSGCYWDDGTDEIWSLRSRRCGVDVSRIAENFGGGGHTTASGFRRKKS